LLTGARFRLLLAAARQRAAVWRRRHRPLSPRASYTPCRGMSNRRGICLTPPPIRQSSLAP